MDVDLPPPVRILVDALNDGDTDAFVACFTPDGVVDDGGRHHIGPDAVRRWCDDEAIGVGVEVTPTGVEVSDSTEAVVTVEVIWATESSDHRDRTFVFALQGGRIEQLAVSATHDGR